jgi:UDP-N-acetylmuramate--alanine ligase
VVGALGGDRIRAAEALRRFSGVGRRFERVGEAGGVTVIDDYAHHPTELVATLAAARQAFPGRRLVAAFQPHLFSRTALHSDAMGAALAAADVAVVTDIYPARETPIPGITGALVADAALRRGVRVIYQPVRADVADTVRSVLEPGDVLVTLGAGDITRVGRGLLPVLASR